MQTAGGLAVCPAWPSDRQRPFELASTAASPESAERRRWFGFCCKHGLKEGAHSERSEIMNLTARGGCQFLMLSVHFGVGTRRCMAMNISRTQYAYVHTQELTALSFCPSMCAFSHCKVVQTLTSAAVSVLPSG